MESEIGVFLERPTVRFALMVVVFVLLAFIAIKDGFSLWLLSKSEHLVGPKGSAAQAISAYDSTVLSGGLYSD
jgi:hypothetical protein